MPTRAAQGAHEAEAVEAGQHPVDDHHVVIFRRGLEQAVASIGKAIDAVALLGKAVGDIGRGVAVILDDQDAHGLCLQRSAAHHTLELRRITISRPRVHMSGPTVRQA